MGQHHGPSSGGGVVTLQTCPTMTARPGVCCSRVDAHGVLCTEPAVYAVLIDLSGLGHMSEHLRCGLHLPDVDGAEVLAVKPYPAPHRDRDDEWDVDAEFAQMLLQEPPC
jgi:hypothetical protein